MSEHTLTTITPTWGRDMMLMKWVAHVQAATRPWVRHLVLLVNEEVPEWWRGMPANMEAHSVRVCGGTSLGTHHNMGAMKARSEWVMKLDVDTIPHLDYWDSLLPVLNSAGPVEWFNAGMGYMTQRTSEQTISGFTVTSITGDVVLRMLQSPRDYFVNWRGAPSGTNFIARRHVYLNHASCDGRFRGYGWEDYQQIFELERYQLGRNPLAGRKVQMANVTQLCRDQIGLRKSRELWKRDNRLCLLHHWHPIVRGGSYRDRRQMDLNKAVLLEHCLRDV